MKQMPMLKMNRCYGIYVKEAGDLCWDSVSHERKTLLKQLRENGLSDREWQKTWVIHPVVVSPAPRKGHAK